MGCFGDIKKLLVTIDNTFFMCYTKYSILNGLLISRIFASHYFT